LTIERASSMEQVVRMMPAILRTIAFLAIAALASSLDAGAQENKSPGDDPWLRRMVGRWVLNGRIAGKDTTHDVQGNWVLNHLYVRLHEVSREKDTRGRPAYEAIVYVTRDVVKGEYAVLWLDNTASGAFADEGTGHARLNGESLPFVFKNARGEVSFKNTFVYDSATQTWTWLMDNVDEGVSKPFGRVKLSKR
jgi:hypothetical protein